MTRRSPGRRWTPHRTLDVTVPDVVRAPELAVLALLDQALRISAEALLAAQPALLGEPPSWRVTSELLAARRLLLCGARLARALLNYRSCVLHAPDAEDRGDHDRLF